MKVYTRTVCPKCMLTKTLLDEAEIKYEVANLDFDSQAESMLKEKGFMGLPVIEHEGSFYADNASIQKLIAELAE